ncbi:hypothetical protein CGMCC3_g6392 [Colletotrichum fructicola]|nr:uncharacterized protein CGMCC3_g6392 [Colletotrichum fructicola]KAE9577874.1 hypothetical protein CGMCC3_g6392 [Colletotrichum fructicola]
MVAVNDWITQYEEKSTTATNIRASICAGKLVGLTCLRGGGRRVGTLERKFSGRDLRGLTSVPDRPARDPATEPQAFESLENLKCASFQINIDSRAPI